MAAATSKRRSAYSHIKRAEGKRSGLEVKNAEHLLALGCDAKYEPRTIEYSIGLPKLKKYKPDFELPNGILVETKGWFKSADRTKHLIIKHQHPNLDIRLVFSRSKGKIGKKSKMTVADWCNKNGFKWADELVPEAWTKEPCVHSERRLEQIIDEGSHYLETVCVKCRKVLSSKCLGVN